MKAILHIPSGELVQFVRLTASAKPMHNGLYFVFKINGKQYSPLVAGGMRSDYPFRTALKENEHIELLLQSLTQCKFLAEEFIVVDYL
jgi:hypothetical protein